MTQFNNPHDALRHHVSGAVGRGEKEAITAVEATASYYTVTHVTTDGTATDVPGDDLSYKDLLDMLTEPGQEIRIERKE